MAANGACPRLRSEICIPQCDSMTSSPSPVDTVTARFFVISFLIILCMFIYACM